MRTVLTSGICLLVAGSVGTLLAQEPVPVSTEELRLHALPSVVRDIPALSPGSIPQRARVRITVDTAGNVLSVDAESAYKAKPYWPEIEKRIHAWRFRPIERDGFAVNVQAVEYLRVVQREEPVSIRPDAPQLNPASTVVCTLRKTHCFGTCPVYSVTVDTSGAVRFSGRANVVAPGEHMATVEPGARSQTGRALSRRKLLFAAGRIQVKCHRPAHQCLIDRYRPPY